MQKLQHCVCHIVATNCCSQCQALLRDWNIIWLLLEDWDYFQNDVPFSDVLNLNLNHCTLDYLKKPVQGDLPCGANT